MQGHGCSAVGAESFLPAATPRKKRREGDGKEEPKEKRRDGREKRERETERRRRRSTK